MTDAMTAWLALTALASAFTFIAVMRGRSAPASVLALVLCASAAFPAAFLPLSHASPFGAPRGTYDLLGAHIDEGRNLYVLVNIDGEPRLFVMPYSQSKADELQGALNDMGAGGSGAVSFGDGGASYDGEPPVTGSNNKDLEQPAL